MKKLLILLLMLLILAPLAVSKPKLRGEEGRYIIVLNWQPPNNEIERVKQFYSSFIVGKDFESAEPYLDEMRRTVKRLLDRAFEPYYQIAVKLIESFGGQVVAKIPSFGAVVAYLPKWAVKDLARSSLVAEIYEDFKIHVCLDVAVPSLLPGDWYAAGYNGSNDIGDLIKGVEVAVCDTGIDQDHLALPIDRMVDQRDFSDDNTVDDLNGHGTMVAGIIASQDARYRGIAYGVNLINAKCMDSQGAGQVSWLMEAVEWAVSGATDTAEVINTSLGTTDYSPDGQNLLAKFADYIVSYYSVVWTTAAGNEDPDTGDKTLNVPGDAYNVITVGAVDDRGTVDRSDDVYAWFSCVGPTTDGRIKPDVVAPGASITSTAPKGVLGTGDGTSFATPLVAGAAAIIAPYAISKFGSMWYLAVKALLIGSADDWDVPGPDAKTGWGYVNLKTAWTYKESLYVAKLSKASGEDTITFSVILLSGDTIKATLVWDRVFKQKFLGDYLFYDLSDFEAELYSPSGKLVASTSKSPDNVRQLVYTANESGTYTLIVRLESIDPDLDAARGGDYVAVFANTTLVMGVLNLKTKISTKLSKNTIFDNENLQLKISVKNECNDTIVNASLKIVSQLFFESGYYEIPLGDIEPNQTIVKELTLKPISVGSERVEVRLYGKYHGSKLPLNFSQFYINVFDDDDSMPSVEIIDVSSIGIVFSNIKVTVKAKDESGISAILLYYRVGSQVRLGNNEVICDGVIILNVTDPNQQIFEISVQISPSWIGKTVYFAAVAVDADNDRPGDQLKSLLSTNVAYKVPVETNVIVVAVPILILLLVAIVGRSKKSTKPRRKVRRIYEDAGVIYI